MLIVDETTKTKPTVGGVVLLNGADDDLVELSSVLEDSMLLQKSVQHRL